MYIHIIVKKFHLSIIFLLFLKFFNGIMLRKYKLGEMTMNGEQRRNQIIEKAFYPRTLDDYLDGIEQKWAFRSDEKEIRFMAVDIAVSVGSNEDNTAIILGKLDLITGLREVYYVDSINGMNSVEQAVLFKRLFYEWKAKYFVMDSTGIYRCRFIW